MPEVGKIGVFDGDWGGGAGREIVSARNGSPIRGAISWRGDGDGDGEADLRYLMIHSLPQVY